MAPEMLRASARAGRGYTLAVDWWALGILIYELMTGLPPFYDEDERRAEKKTKHKALKFPSPEEIGHTISEEAKDLIGQLLEREPEQRLGTAGGLEAVLSDPWFADVDRAKLLAKELPPGWSPDVKPDHEYAGQDLSDQTRIGDRTWAEVKGQLMGAPLEWDPEKPEAEQPAAALMVSIPFTQLNALDCSSSWVRERGGL